MGALKSRLNHLGTEESISCIEWVKPFTTEALPENSVFRATPPQGQQIRSKIDSFQNANFLISQSNPMMLPLIGIVSERRFQ